MGLARLRPSGRARALAVASVWFPLRRSGFRRARLVPVVSAWCSNSTAVSCLRCLRGMRGESASEVTQLAVSTIAQKRAGVQALQGLFQALSFLDKQSIHIRQAKNMLAPGAIL